MNHLLMIAVLVTYGGYGAHGKKKDRERMLAEQTQGQFKGNLLKSYGCYCGHYRLNYGDPKDHIDHCCQILNCCYNYLKTEGCDATKTSYAYTYDGKDVECEIANNFAWCKRRVCMCDSYFAFCLRDTHDLFNPDLVNLKRRDCPKGRSLC